MDPQVGGSFIPKAPLQSGARLRGSGPGLVMLVAVAILIASLAAAGGVFAYVGFLNTSISGKSESLRLARDAYNEASIKELVRLDARMQNAEKILSAHVAPSAIFDFLSAATLEKVQFTEFKYSLSPEGGAQIDLSGVADSFPTVALQSDQLGASKVLRNVIFSDIQVEPTGKVSFSVAASVDPALILYSRRITGTPQEGVLPPPPPPAPAPTSTATSTQP